MMGKQGCSGTQECGMQERGNVSHPRPALPLILDGWLGPQFPPYRRASLSTRKPLGTALGCSVDITYTSQYPTAARPEPRRLGPLEAVPGAVESCEEALGAVPTVAGARGGLLRINRQQPNAGKLLHKVIQCTKINAEIKIKKLGTPGDGVPQNRKSGCQKRKK